MKPIHIVVVLFGLCLPHQAAAQENCRAIHDNKARLECFDKSFDDSKSERKSKKAAELTEGSWQLERDKDAMTDKVSCAIVNAQNRHIQINIGQMYIGYQGLGGVKSFTFRIDDQPASEMQLVDEAPREIGFVSFEGPAFDSIFAGSRLRVQTVTALNSLINEDIDISSAKRLYARMKRTCQNS